MWNRNPRSALWMGQTSPRYIDIIFLWDWLPGGTNHILVPNFEVLLFVSRGTGMSDGTCRVCQLVLLPWSKQWPCVVSLCEYQQYWRWKNQICLDRHPASFFQTSCWTAASRKTGLRVNLLYIMSSALSHHNNSILYWNMRKRAGLLTRKDSTVFTVAVARLATTTTYIVHWQWNKQLDTGR